MPDLHQPPLSVWATGQVSHRGQRTGRYRAASTAHPARMLPAIARQAITTYTRPGDLVIDPMCGIGTTLVEAIHLGRDSIGVDLEPRWVELTERNLALAVATGATGLASVTTGDARHLPRVLAPLLTRPAAMILTSAYGPFTHGRVRTPQKRGGVPAQQWNLQHAATPNQHDLAGMPQRRRLEALTQILTACAGVLPPGGIMVITARPGRHGDHLVDFPGDLIHAATNAGLALIDRCAALLAGLHDDHVIPRVSFVALHDVRAARRNGLPLQAIAHEDVLVFQRGEQTNG